jgi:hypothetical protein
MNDRDRLEALFAAARAREPLDSTALERTERRVRASLRARSAARRRLVSTVTFVVLTAAGGALAVAATGAFIERASIPRAEPPPGEVILTIPSDSALEIVVRKRRVDRAPSTKAPAPIDPPAAISAPAKPAEIELIPPEPPRSPKTKLEYVPRAFREIDLE